VRQAVDQLEQEGRDLELEVAAAESSARLEALGRSLGMAPPQWGEEVPLP
jgi:cell division protein FtsL